MLNETYDVLVVGAGPAGQNAALVLGRALRRVALCDGGEPRNAAAGEMHGFLTRDGYSPRALERTAREELSRYPSIDVIEDAVIGIDGPAMFTAGLRGGRRLRARRVLLATGMRDDLPAVDGLHERWGHSVFVCPHCDGWEFRGRRIGVYGAPADVVGLAQELQRWSSDLVLFGMNAPIEDPRRRAWLERSGLERRSASPRALEGARGTLSAVVCDDGARVACNALFLCVALLQRSPLAGALGCALDENGAVRIDATHRTTVPGIYACGDMVARVHQVIVAAASGVQAAIAIDEALLDEDLEAVIA